jgi:putative tricarboxylic transport membrane protein
MNEKQPGKPPWKERINFNVIGAAFFILFSIIFYLLIPYQIAKPRLFMGRALVEMKPTLFPRITMVVLLSLSVWYLIQSFHLKEKNLFRELPARMYIKIAVSVGILLAYAMLFERLGFVISSMLVVGILPLYYGYRNILIYVLAFIGTPLAIYFLFTRVLKVSLPESPFF